MKNLNQAEEALTLVTGESAFGRKMFEGQIKRLKVAIKEAIAEDAELPITCWPFPSEPPNQQEDLEELSGAVKVVADEAAPEGNDSLKAVAGTKLKAGEVILVEHSSTFWPCFDQPEAHLSHCANCLRYTNHGLPCPTCCEVMFCGMKCLR